MKNKRLKLEQKEKGQTIEADFGPNGLLFLASLGSGLYLEEKPAAGSIIHAVFVCRGRSVSAVPLHAATQIVSDNSDFKLRDGDSISVGLTNLTFVKDRRVWPRWIRLAVAVTLIAIPLTFAAIVVVRSMTAREGPAKEVPVKTEVETKLENLSDRRVDEAREYLRRGLAAQARLTLIEAIESSQGADEARKLLDAMNSGEVEPVASALEIRRPQEEGEALTLLQDGKRFEISGDLAAAIAKFRSAEDVAGKMKTASPSASAIKEARISAEEKFKAMAISRIDKIKMSLNAMGTAHPGDALPNLAVWKKELDGMLGVMPGIEGALTAKKEVDGRMKVLTGRLISSALTAEKFSGCAKAIQMYEEIISRTQGVDPEAQNEAAQGIKRCRKE